MSFFVGDVGSVIELICRDYEDADGIKTDIGPLDISDSITSEIEFIFTKPGGTTVIKTKTGAEIALTTDGLDGKAQYTTDVGFLDVAGSWWVQGRITTTTGAVHKSEKTKLVVES